MTKNHLKTEMLYELEDYTGQIMDAGDYSETEKEGYQVIEDIVIHVSTGCGSIKTDGFEL